MKYLISFLTFLTLCFNSLYSQSKAQKAYEYVVSIGISTGASFIALTVKDLNTGTVKEIYTVVNPFYRNVDFQDGESFEKTQNELLSKSSDRYFEIKDSVLLKNLNFYAYTYKNKDKITKIIETESIIDSLADLSNYRKFVKESYYRYMDEREKTASYMKKDETDLKGYKLRMIYDLASDDNSDYRFNDEYKELTSSEKRLLKKWNKLIKPHKDKYDSYQKELKRREWKFFGQYYKKYGLEFCHAAFNYGAIFYQNCENGIIQFDQIIEWLQLSD